MKNKKLFIVCLFLIEICSLFLTYKSYGNKILDNVKEEYEVDKETFSMYVETKDNEGNISYEEYNDSNIFPTGYKINLEKSKCTDTKGNLINGILSGSGNKVTVTSNKTAYCYVYFDIDYTLSQLCSSGDNLGSCLIDNNEEIDSLGDTAYSEMYRYTGTDEIVDDNYICFGTTDKNTCINNPDKYMYRVIGVTSKDNTTLGLETGQVKLIKDTNIGTHEWYSDYKTDITWESSTIYSYLQGSEVLGNSDIITNGWSSKIDNVKWNIGDVQTITDAVAISESEKNAITIGTSKIGLIYLSDYYYAYNSGGTQNCNSEPFCLSWATDISNTMWTMTRYGNHSSGWGGYVSWRVGDNGYVGSYYMDNPHSVRPVFYLNKDEVFASGNGTIDNPIIVSGPIMHTVNVSSNNTTYGTVTPTTQEVVDTGNATITISPNTGYKYSSNTCGVELVDNVITINNVTSDKECTVIFEPNKYSLTLTKGTGISTIYYKINGASSYTSVTSTQTLNVNYGSTYYYYGVASTGYTISSCTTSSPCSGTMGTSAVSKTLSATLNTYGLTLTKGTGISTIYYKINGASSYTSATSTKTLNVNYGSTYYYYGVASTGYTISSCTASNPCSGTMGTSAVSKTLSATLNKYSLTLTKGTGISTIYYKINGASSYTSATSTQTLNVNYGSTYYYYGVASTGYTISSCTASSPCSGTMGTSAVSKTLSATLNKYTVSVSSTNTSYGTVSPANQSINHGSAATITLNPKTGYKYSSNTCGGTVSGNTMTISNITAAKTCTVTFEKLTPFGEYLISAKTAGWNSTAYSGMYRYIGTDTSVNNYVKIGDVLYRIIGVTSAANGTLGLAANQVKVIKAATIGNYNWHGSYTSDIKWESSAMYTYLNDLDSDTTNQVLSNTSIIPSGWSSKISSVKWNIGDVKTYINGDTVYGLEDNTQTTNTSKVGLMYLSDYFYAYNAGGTQNCSYSPYCVSWMTDSRNYTWTMSRYGKSSYYRAWPVVNNGSIEYTSLNNTFAVYPVFYLSTSVNYVSGSGTSDDPFIIE